MQRNAEFTALLIIRHPNADPAVLTQELGLEPEYSWRAGDPRDSETGAEAGGTYRESYWAARFYPYPEPSPFPTFEAMFEAFGTPAVTLPMPLESVLAVGTFILKRRRDFWQRLKSEGGSAEFLVSLASHDSVNLRLPADLLGTMASLGLSLSVDVECRVPVSA